MKTCTSCKQEKPLDSYSTNKMGKDKKQPMCKACLLDRQRKRRSGRNTAQLKYQYGLTLEQYNGLLTSQDNKCFICKSDFDFNSMGAKHPCIDHNHTTGQVRSILCRNCNTALGHAKESISILEAMIYYIKEPPSAL